MSDTGILLNQRSGATTRVNSTNLYSFCRENDYSMAIWREPGKSVQAIIDSGDTRIKEIELESMEPGFLFHPYNESKDIHFIRSMGMLIKDEEGFQWSDDQYGLSDEYVTFMKDRKADEKSPEMTYSEIVEDAAQSAYIDLVNNARQAIIDGKFHKVVPSRYKEIDFTTIDLDTILKRLTQSYPNAFISLTYTPDAGLWVGASPEILVQTSGPRFKTVALAGTQPRKEDVELDEIAWTQKEIEEQAYVSRYVINCFKKIRLREFTEAGPKSVISGNLIHLKTSFTVDMEEVGFPQLGTVMMQLLHPTSAVCGMPKIPAEAWLNEHEGYDREYFSGFLGPVNIEEETGLYVNLRCMKIEGNRAKLFAGAGVTEDSKAHKEWKETEYKMQTLLDVIY